MLNPVLPTGRCWGGRQFLDLLAWSSVRRFGMAQKEGPDGTNRLRHGDRNRRTRRPRAPPATGHRRSPHPATSEWEKECVDCLAVNRRLRSRRPSRSRRSTDHPPRAGTFASPRPVVAPRRLARTIPPRLAESRTAERKGRFAVQLSRARVSRRLSTRQRLQKEWPNDEASEEITEHHWARSRLRAARLCPEDGPNHLAGSPSAHSDPAILRR